MYIKHLVNTYVLKGEYKSYLAYTYTDVSGNYNNNSPDIYIVFSEDDIISEENTFKINGKSIKISIDTNSANRNSIESRYVFTENVGTITVPHYEFIYTNAVHSKYADLIALEKYSEIQNVESNISYNITKEEFYIIPTLLALLIMMLFLKWCFPMKGGKKV